MIRYGRSQWRVDHGARGCCDQAKGIAFHKLAKLELWVVSLNWRFCLQLRVRRNRHSGNLREFLNSIMNNMFMTLLHAKHVGKGILHKKFRASDPINCFLSEVFFWLCTVMTHPRFWNAPRVDWWRLGAKQGSLPSCRDRKLVVLVAAAWPCTPRTARIAGRKEAAWKQRKRRIFCWISTWWSNQRTACTAMQPKKGQNAFGLLSTNRMMTKKKIKHGANKQIENFVRCW